MSKKDILYDLFKKCNIQIDKLNSYANDKIDEIYEIMVNNLIKEYEDGFLNYICGIYFEFIKKNNDEAKKYYLLAIARDSSDAMYKYACLLLKEDKINEAKSYYLMAIAKDNTSAMYHYACLLLKENNTVEAKKYYLMASEKDDADAMNYYAFISEEEGNILEAKKYYLMAIDKNMPEAIFNYADLLEKEGKIDDAKHYYLIGFANGDTDAIDNYKTITSKTEQYYYLNNLVKSDTVTIYLTELLQDREVQIFKRKIELLGRQDECPICYENRTLIPTQCIHFLCLGCYFKIDKCPICNYTLNNSN